mmetsp:Transcript_71331/g.127192  ORF Transcript_71331/g.127192 Transcript_71331/m.127192 type:complete len:353 (-) Transcript_71331:174-1232(-)
MPVTSLRTILHSRQFLRWLLVFVCASVRWVQLVSASGVQPRPTAVEGATAAARQANQTLALLAGQQETEPDDASSTFFGQLQKTWASIFSVTPFSSKQPMLEHTLRICNAYAWTSPMDVYRVHAQQGESPEQAQNADFRAKRKREVLTNTLPLEYMECRDFLLALDDGDQISFRTGSIDVGTFFTTGLPKKPATLLLIPHRRDRVSMAVAFESHIFTEVDSAQIAVVDTYRGSEKGRVKLLDGGIGSEQGVVGEDELRFGTVVTVSPGRYKAVLAEPSGKIIRETVIDAKYYDKIVAIRTGNTAKVKNAPAFPESFIVFPSSAWRMVKCSLTAFFVPILITLMFATGPLSKY